MFPVINATATKPSPSSKIGICWIQQDYCVKITEVVEGGLFSKSGLEEGQEIITVNGTHVDGLSTDEVKAVFASVETKINITARPKPFNAFFQINRRIVRETKPYPNDPKRTYTVKRTVNDYDMNCNPHGLPEIMKAAGVPPHKWRKIYHLIVREMAEATAESEEMDRTFQNEMVNYSTKQMQKGFMGIPGQESNHEKKVLHMTHQCAALANNATLAATDVSIRANALLAPHGISASLYLMKLKLPKYSTKQNGEAKFAKKPYGLRFLSLE